MEPAKKYLVWRSPIEPSRENELWGWPVESASRWRDRWRWIRWRPERRLPAKRSLKLNYEAQFRKRHQSATRQRRLHGDDAEFQQQLPSPKSTSCEGDCALLVAVCPLCNRGSPESKGNFKCSYWRLLLAAYANCQINTIPCWCFFT